MKVIRLSKIEQKTGLDEKTGLPQDYAAFFDTYRPLMLAAASRANIPIQDREDAVQEVQIKFWQKNGLDLFDADRGTKFATFLRNWTGLFLLQERDKVNKNVNRNFYSTVTESPELFEKPLLEKHTDKYVVRQEFVNNWGKKAESALRESGKFNLVPVLKLCVLAADGGTAPRRAEIAVAAGVNINKATATLKELREVLTDAGLGMESLYD